MTRTARLAKAATADLIAEYNEAISSHSGRYTNTSPRQQRIDAIVDTLSDRADQGDTDALAWFAN